MTSWRELLAARPTASRPMGAASEATVMWGPHRQRVAALAVATAALTGAVAAALGASLFGATLYVAIAAGALLVPAAITFQVLNGVLLVAGVLDAGNGLAPLPSAFIVAGVVASAELLALVARLDDPAERDPAADLRRAGLASLVGGGVFGLVALVADLPGPGGLLALVLGAGACVVLAGLTVGLGRMSSPENHSRRSP